MALPTLTVIDGTGAPQTVKTLNDGRQAAADAQSVVISAEDFAALGAPNEAAPMADNDPAGLNGRLQRLAEHLSTLIAVQPTAELIETTRTLAFSDGQHLAVSNASVRSVPISATEVAISPSVDMFVRVGDSSVTAAAGAGSLFLAAGSGPHYLQILSGSYVAAIRDGSDDGVLSILPVA